MTVPPAPEGSETPGEEPHESATIHLFMEQDENRRLLVDLLAPQYEIEMSATDGVPKSGVDACIVDTSHFQRAHDALEAYKTRAAPVFFPILLIGTPQQGSGSNPAVWDYVDDVVETPIGKTELQARLSNLLTRRQTSARLVDRERTLERTVAALEQKERAMDAAPIGITITDPTRPDNPTVYANAAFERITGYEREEILGRNMRFLQGPATDDEAVETLREGIASREQTSATLVNYRADGTQFWNRVDIAPVHDETGTLVNYVGFQTDVSDERIREQRLDVLNRMMRHNLSNNLNIIGGYADTLLDDVEDPERRAAIEEINRAAENLKKLGEDVRRVERTLQRSRQNRDPVDVRQVLTQVREQVKESYPEAEITLDVEDGPWHVVGSCLDDVFTELFKNAVQHADTSEPTISVSVGPTDDATDHAAIRIVDDGPGITDDLIDVFRVGKETQLNHGDGFGLWLVYWVVTLLGGEFTITSGDGTVVTLTLPTVDVGVEDA
jgi:PAS domain S-box-containing protein